MQAGDIRVWRRVCLIYVGMVTLLSLFPKGPDHGPLFFNGEDKVVHIGMYAGMMLAAVLAEREAAGRHRAMRSLVALGAFAWGYSLAMEFVQGLFQFLGRSCSVGDMIANLIGVVMGGSWVTWLRRTRLGAWFRPPVDASTMATPGGGDALV